MKEYPVTYECGRRLAEVLGYILLDDDIAQKFTDQGFEINRTVNGGYTVQRINNMQTGGKNKVSASILHHAFGTPRIRRFHKCTKNDYTRTAYFTGAKTPSRSTQSANVVHVQPTKTAIEAPAGTITVHGVDVTGDPSFIAEVIKNLAKDNVTN